jgi:hypothetical protein
MHLWLSDVVTQVEKVVREYNEVKWMRGKGNEGSWNKVFGESFCLLSSLRRYLPK